jgi:hypothetical protein
MTRQSSAQSSWPGYVTAIHVFPGVGAVKTWMPGTRPGMTINSMFVIPGRDLARASMRNCVSKNPKPLIQVQ